MTLTTLPPFLLLGCLVGLVQGADVLAADRGLAPMHLAAQACENVHVFGSGDGSGLSSGTTRKVKPKDVHLTIRIQPPPSPGGRRQIIVEQHVPNDDNKVLLTLLAALAIIVVAIAVAYVARLRRQSGRRA